MEMYANLIINIDCALGTIYSPVYLSLPYDCFFASWKTSAFLYLCDLIKYL